MNPDLSHVAAWVERQISAADATIAQIMRLRATYVATTGKEPRFVVLGWREYDALQDAAHARGQQPSAVSLETVVGLEVVRTLRGSFVAVCDTEL